jgi:hypothetical protein
MGVFVTIIPFEDITFSTNFRSEHNTGDILILRVWIRNGVYGITALAKCWGEGSKLVCAQNVRNLSHKKEVLFLSSSFPDGKQFW